MDFLHDNTHAVLLDIHNSYGMPDYVMNANALTKSASDSMSDRLYADEFNRKYPLDSPADTWLSAAYFAKTAESDGYRPEVKDLVEENIKHAASVYGISEDVEFIMNSIRTPAAEKKAEDEDSNYGYAPGRMYPMFDESGVKKASSYFSENYMNYPADVRKEIATNILKKCAEYEVSPSSRVLKEARIGVASVPFMMEQLEDRAYRYGNEKIAEQVIVIKKEIGKADPSEVAENINGIHDLISNLDHTFGLDGMYGKKILAPSDFMFNVPMEEAREECDDTCDLDGVHMSVKQLAKLPMKVFSDALGDDFCGRIKITVEPGEAESEEIDPEKLSDEIHSMIVPDKKSLLKSIKAYTA